MNFLDYHVRLLGGTECLFEISGHECKVRPVCKFGSLVSQCNTGN